MLPNFLIAGVAKAGTTSLYYYLKQHPEVDIPRKETFYFAREFYKNAPGDKPPHFRDKARIIFTNDEYDKFYKGCNKKAIGEVSTCYAYFYESSIPLIRKKLGDVKIIFVLRNPVERAFSAYNHFIRLNAEPLSFREALKEEKLRMEKHWDFMWYYAAVGFYANQVKTFKDNFSQVKIFLSDDLSSNPSLIMKELFQFLRVDDSFIAETSLRYNEANVKPGELENYLSKKSAGANFIKSVLKKTIPEKTRMEWRQKSRKAISTPASFMPGDVREELIDLYKDDMIKLEKIIDRDLSEWRIKKKS